jgi:hypothetical protein
MGGWRPPELSPTTAPAPGSIARNPTSSQTPGVAVDHTTDAEDAVDTAQEGATTAEYLYWAKQHRGEESPSSDGPRMVYMVIIQVTVCVNNKIEIVTPVRGTPVQCHFGLGW